MCERSIEYKTLRKRRAVALLAERLSLLPGTSVSWNRTNECEEKAVNMNSNRNSSDDGNSGGDEGGDEGIENGENTKKRHFKPKNKKQHEDNNNNNNNNTAISNGVNSSSLPTDERSEWVYGFDRVWKEKQKEMEMVGEDIVPVEVEVERSNAQRWRRCIVYWCFQKDEVVGKGDDE